MAWPEPAGLSLRGRLDRVVGDGVDQACSEQRGWVPLRALDQDRSVPAGHQSTPCVVRGIGPVAVQHHAARLGKAGMNRSQESRVGVKLRTRRRRAGITTEPVLKLSRAEVHAHKVRVTRIFTDVVSHGDDLDIPVDPAGASRSSQVVAADARLSVENRPKAVTPMSSRGRSSPRLSRTIRVPPSALAPTADRPRPDSGIRLVRPATSSERHHRQAHLAARAAAWVSVPATDVSARGIARGFCWAWTALSAR